MTQLADKYGLSERSQHLLKTLVDRYIRDGQPVGSKKLAQDAGGGLSPATIRNVMYELEEMGLLQSPHTSAGRVPTVAGYRIFVDSLLKVTEPNSMDVQQLQMHLGGDVLLPELIDRASNMLSGITHMAGIVTVPRLEQAQLTHIEFIPLSAGRILTILVLEGKEVQNRIFNADKTYTQSQLQELANFLNSEFVGMTLQQIRARVLASMKSDRVRLDDSMRTAISMAEQVFQDEDKEKEGYVVAGQANLLEFNELTNIERLKELFVAFTQKKEILHLLDRCLISEGLHIFIGDESGYQVFDQCSLVTSSYTVKGKVIGTVGVIGPTRMAYDRVIPIVDVTAKLLAAALNSGE